MAYLKSECDLTKYVFGFLKYYLTPLLWENLNI